jgi:hypothetical protein
LGLEGEAEEVSQGLGSLVTERRGALFVGMPLEVGAGSLETVVVVVLGAIGGGSV